MSGARMPSRKRWAAVFALALSLSAATALPQAPPTPQVAPPPPVTPPATTTPSTPQAAPPLPVTAPATTLELTLADAIERARAASPHLAELRSLAAGAGAGLAGARAQRLPQIDVSAGYTRQSDVPELRLTVPGVGERTLFPNIPDSYRAHAGFALPLYTGGRIERTVAASAELLAASRQDIEQGQADLVQETVIAYWNLVTARVAERVLTASLDDYETHLKEARDRRDVGMAASNEVLAVEVQRYQAELSRLQAATSARVANANLLRLLALGPEVEIDPTDPLTESAAAPATPAITPGAAPATPAITAGATPAVTPGAAPAVSAAGGSAVTAAGAPATPLAGPPTGHEPPETLIAAAQAARPEIMALRSRIAANRASAAATRAALYPQASLAAGYDYANPNPRILPLAPQWRSSWSAGATISVSLFDGGRTAAASAQLEAQADALGHRLEDLERRVRLEVTQRLLELATAREAEVVAGRSIEAARENVRVARDRYHEGIIPSSELLDAEIALLRSGLDRASAASQVRIALANLSRAVGR